MKKTTWMMTITAVCAAAVLGSACSRKPQEETTQAPTTVEESTAAVTEPETETQEPTQAEAKDRYHILQGTITEVKEEGTIAVLQADDGQEYTIDLGEIKDVEANVEADSQVAILYIGDEDYETEGNQPVLMLPEQEEWSIYQETGTTLFNAMSSFTIKTEDDREISLLKDNCPMEDGALTADSGEKITVFYVTAGGDNFPIEVLKAD